MRIISLNVAQLVGRSGFIPLARRNAPKVAPKLAALLAAEEPDILALQEAPPPIANFDPVAQLLGVNPRVHVIRHDGPRHGPALLTYRPLASAAAHLFAEHRRDGKGFACAEVETPIGNLLVASVHLAVVHRPSRRAQIDRLAEALRIYRGPKVVLGDLNDGKDAPLYLAERLDLVPHGPGPTFPSRAPALRLDWVFASPEIRVVRVDVLRHLPSDHCAVRVDIDLQERHETRKPQTARQVRSRVL